VPSARPTRTARRSRARWHPRCQESRVQWMTRVSCPQPGPGLQTCVRWSRSMPPAWPSLHAHSSGRRLVSLSHSLSLSLSPLQVVLAGLGLWGSISSLGVMQTLLGRSLFVPPMMASGIIFFAGPSPPSPQGFLSGSVCSATISLGALMALQPVFSPVVAQVRTPSTIPAPPIWLPEADLTPSPRNLTASHPRRLGRAPPQAPS